MKHRRFQDLSIVSTKKPFNTHLWWEHSTYGFLMVDSADQTVLLFSTKARLLVDGSDWDIVDLSDNANSYKIQSGWLDGNDLWLVMCDNDGTADDFEVCFIEFDDSNDCNPIGVLVGANADTVYAGDIFKIGSDIFVFNYEVRGANKYLVIWDVDTAPFTEKAKVEVSYFGSTGFYKNVVTGTIYYGIIYIPALGDIYAIVYDNSIPSILFKVNQLEDYEIPTNKSQAGASYDDSNLIYFVAKQTADGKNYLVSYSITGDSFTVLSEYDIALMLDRNNSATVPNEFEKGFSIGASEIVYEIKARRGGVRVLQDMSVITDAVIIAITDNFLMNNDGDMFEFTEVSNEVSTIRYSDGIIGVQKRGVFTVHPDFHINWSKGDSIKIYDDNDLLEFHGLINDKNRNSRGIYIFKIDSFTNEIYRKTYNNSYSADDTDTKQKDIIDNGCDFCYRSSSIVGTTTTYDYIYNRAITYLFWLARFLERQVPYVEPDGKIWTKAYNGLTATGKSWDLNDNNQEVSLIDIPSLEEIVQGFFDGNSGVTRNTIRYKNNATAVRPVAATRDPIEQLQGILPLNEFRDPKLEAATEANQLGDNRYNIWSADIIFLGLRIEGQGYLQPGKTIQIQNTGQITIAQDDFLILSFERDPKNDVYMGMILSDNIIFPKEFNNLQNTTITQVHTASVQAIENQSDLTTHAALPSAHHTATPNAPEDIELFCYGFDGFLENNNFKNNLRVAFSDVNAGIACSAYVDKGGTFRLGIHWRGNANMVGKTVGIQYNVAITVDGETVSNDIAADAFDLPCGGVQEHMYEVDDTDIVVPNNGVVGVYFIKNDNADGATDWFMVDSMVLVRQ